MKYTNQEEYLVACRNVGNMTSLVVSLCTDDSDAAKAAFRSGYDMLKNHVNKASEEYSFLLGLSNTDTKNSEKEVPYHLHGVIMGDNSYEFTQEIARRINRKAKLANEKAGIDKRAIPAKTQKITGLDEDFDDRGMRFVEYVLTQSSYKQQYSNADDENKFDFRHFNKEE
jgi:hypothetical protein